MDSKLSSEGAISLAPDISVYRQAKPEAKSLSQSGQPVLEERVQNKNLKAPEKQNISQQNHELHHALPELSNLREDPDIDFELFPEQGKQETPTESKSFIQKMIKSDFIQKDISNASNILSLVGNGISSIVNILPANKKSKEIATFVGSLSTKLVLGINGAIGGLNQLFLKKNLISGLCHLAENLVIALFPQNQIYFARGINSGLNLVTFGLNLYDNRDTFRDFGDYLSTIGPNLSKAFSELSLSQIPKGEDFFIRIGKYLSTVAKNIASKDSGLISIVNGLGMAIGTAFGLATPFKLIGELLRNTCGVIQDFDRLKDKAKINNFRSGQAFLTGSVLNYGLMILKNIIGKESYDKVESVIVPMIFSADGLARYFFRRSQDEGETVIAKKRN